VFVPRFPFLLHSKKFRWVAILYREAGEDFVAGGIDTIGSGLVSTSFNSIALCLPWQARGDLLYRCAAPVAKRF
jgi:hypothetical protein